MSSDPLVMEYLPPAEEAWVARARAHWDEHGFGQWVVEVPGGAAFIGVVGLGTISFEAPFTPAVRCRLAARLALLGSRLRCRGRQSGPRLRLRQARPE